MICFQCIKALKMKEDEEVNQDHKMITRDNKVVGILGSGCIFDFLESFGLLSGVQHCAGQQCFVGHMGNIAHIFASSSHDMSQ